MLSIFLIFCSFQFFFFFNFIDFFQFSLLFSIWSSFFNFFQTKINEVINTKAFDERDYVVTNEKLDLKELSTKS